MGSIQLHVILKVENLSLAVKRYIKEQQEKSQRDSKHKSDLNGFASFEGSHKPEGQPLNAKHNSWPMASKETDLSPTNYIEVNCANNLNKPRNELFTKASRKEHRSANILIVAL